MTDYLAAPKGFEARLMHALSEIDAARPTAATAPRPAPARRPHRTRRRLPVIAATLTVALGATAMASASGLFASAPPNVQRAIGHLGTSVDAAKAVQVGVIDSHVVYAAPTSNGGFCLYYGKNPRSGPTGGSCIHRGATSGEAVFSVLMGTDGDLLFGRVGNNQAKKVTASFPRSGETASTPVADSGFFALKIPDRSARSLLIVVQQDPQKKPIPTKDGGPILAFQCDRVPEISVTALDGQGHAVAHGVAVATPPCAATATPGPTH
jgi:hypothetical protein